WCSVSQSLCSIVDDSVWIRKTDVNSLRRRATPTKVQAAAKNYPKSPTRLAVDSSGTIYVADSFNRAIRKLTPDITLTRRSHPLPNSASFLPGAIAPDELITLTGSNFNTQTLVTTDGPLPASLAGTSVRIRDSHGAE